MKKIMISLCLIIASATVAIANSTIYTDDIGRLHFLGKDPGGSSIQPVQGYTNPAQKDLTNIIYKNESSPETSTEETKVNAKGQHTNKTKGSFTYNKGAMDASDPYTFGETNIPAKSSDAASKTGSENKKKHFWDNW